MMFKSVVIVVTIKMVMMVVVSMFTAPAAVLKIVSMPSTTFMMMTSPFAPKQCLPILSLLPISTHWLPSGHTDSPTPPPHSVTRFTIPRPNVTQTFIHLTKL